MHDEDRALVAQLLHGDAGAFERFFAVSFPVVYRFALGRVGNDADAAEEIAQNTLCRAAKHLAGYRGEASLLTWILTICRHQIADHHAARNHRSRELALEDVGGELLAVLESLSSDVSPDQEIRRREVGAQVRRALDRLHPRHRLVLVRKYLEDRSVRVIAEELGSTEKAVESLLSRARVAFRESFLLEPETRRAAGQA